MFIWITTIPALIYFGNFIVRNVLLVGHVEKIEKNLPKAVTTAKLKRKGDFVFRRDGPLLCLKWREKEDVLMLSTIHEAIFVETRKVDRAGNKIEKPEAVYYYCSRMGGVDLSNQLLNYFTFLHKSTKWSRKLLIHLFNLIILNAYILNKHYGLKKMTQDEFRDYMVKYLLREGLKCYKIPLPPVLSKKIGRNHSAEHNAQRLNEWHFITNIAGGEERKRKRPTKSCFVCSKLPGLNCKPKRTSFWCEDCDKPLCITPCFKIYHTEIDFKLHALKFRQEGTRTVLVQGVEGNDGDDNL